MSKIWIFHVRARLGKETSNKALLQVTRVETINRIVYTKLFDTLFNKKT